MNLTMKIDLDLVVIADEETHTFNAFFQEFPEVIADGSTKEEAISNLLHVFPCYLNQQRKKQSAFQHSAKNVNVNTLSFKTTIA